MPTFTTSVDDACLHFEYENCTNSLPFAIICRNIFFLASLWRCGKLREKTCLKNFYTRFSKCVEVIFNGRNIMQMLTSYVNWQALEMPLAQFYSKCSIWNVQFEMFNLKGKAFTFIEKTMNSKWSIIQVWCVRQLHKCQTTLLSKYKLCISRQYN